VKSSSDNSTHGFQSPEKNFSETILGESGAENLRIVGDMYEKLPRDVLPVRIEDLPTETVTSLERFGYTSERIEEALNTKRGSP
jgi:hypothetical protein